MLDEESLQDHWDETWAGVNLRTAPANNVVRQWIEKHVAAVSEGTCFEIGCFPGRFLGVMGALGYEVNGIDLTPRVKALPEWLSGMGYSIGQIVQEDFFEYAPERRFDVVLSLGFIEHFNDWEAVLERHLPLVAPGGLLVLETPNFAGRFQNWLHRRFDFENLARHNVRAMDPVGWAGLLRKHGFEILFEGAFGPFQFWTKPQRRSFAERATLAVLRTGQRITRPFIPSGQPAFAPALGVVARLT